MTKSRIGSMTESVKKRLGSQPSAARVSDDDKKKLESQEAKGQLHNDARQWDNYFNDPRSTPEKVLIMKRIFALIQTVGLETDGDKSNPDNLMLNLASILSHGGRLVIQVPPLGTDNDANPNALTDAILKGIKMEGNVGKRPFASHSLDIEKDGVNEKLLKTTGLRGNYLSLMKDWAKGRHYGMDVGVGYNGAQAEDGTNGHVYFFWQAPTKTSPGGLMIGVETAAPGKTNPYGAKHGAGAVKGEFTPTGGTKFTSGTFDKHRKAGLMLSHEGGLMLNLTPAKMGILSTLEEKANAIGFEQLSAPVEARSSKLTQELRQTESIQETTQASPKTESQLTEKKTRHVFEGLDNYLGNIEANPDVMQVIGSRNGYESIMQLMQTLDQSLLDNIKNSEDKGFRVTVKDAQHKAPLVLFPTKLAADAGNEKQVFSVFEKSGNTASLTLHFDEGATYTVDEYAKWAKIEVDRFLGLSGSAGIEIIGKLPDKFVEAVVDYCAANNIDCKNKSTHAYEREAKRAEPVAGVLSPPRSSQPTEKIRLEDNALLIGKLELSRKSLQAVSRPLSHADDTLYSKMAQHLAKPVHFNNVMAIYGEIKKDAELINRLKEVKPSSELHGKCLNYYANIELLAKRQANLAVFAEMIIRNAYNAEDMKALRPFSMLIEEANKGDFNKLALHVDTLYKREEERKGTHDKKDNWMFNVLTILKENNNGLISEGKFKERMKIEIEKMLLAIKSGKPEKPKDDQREREGHPHLH